jgi:hypothetical protein
VGKIPMLSPDSHPVETAVVRVVAAAAASAARVVRDVASDAPPERNVPATTSRPESAPAVASNSKSAVEVDGIGVDDVPIVNVPPSFTRINPLTFR